MELLHRISFIPSYDVTVSNKQVPIVKDTSIIKRNKLSLNSRISSREKPRRKVKEAIDKILDQKGESDHDSDYSSVKRKKSPNSPKN